MYTLIRTRHRFGRWLAIAIAWTLMLGQFAQPVFAQSVPPILADAAIAAKVQAKPNIVFSMDDSGSMLYTYLPDFVVGSYCRGGNNIAGCAAIPLFNSNFYYPPILAADFNRLAYNPNVTYQPPNAYDGNPKTSAFTDGLGNQKLFTQVQEDPYLSAATNRNLTAKVNVLLYCNTDWPPNTTFGDANGEYLAGSGDWCRINGTKYDVGPTSGAAAVDPDYNYPYNSSSGAFGVDYYFRTLTVKSLWCDTTSPYFPRATTGGSCTTTCTAGTIVKTPQTCNAGAATTACCISVGNAAGCVAGHLSTFSPAGCYGNALYCAPYGTGSAGECTACSCNAAPNGTIGRCSITNANCNCVGYGCTPQLNGNAACPDQVTGCTLGGTLQTTCTGPAASAVCSDKMWDPVNKVYTAVTLLQDSNTNGQVCRHNNQTYAVGGAAGPFKYYAAAPAYPGDVAPADAAQGMTGKFNLQVTGSCPAITNPVAVPRHYYTITSVQFCNTVDVTVNGRWRGFGTGVCQTQNDFSVFKNVQFGPSTPGNPAFKKISLINDGRPFNYVDPVTGAAMSRTYAQEVINYGNWYAYYRSRILAAKTSASIAFSYLDDTYRVGFHNFGVEIPPYGAAGAPAPVWLDVNDWILGLGKQRDLWYQTMFAIAPTVGKTPTAAVMLRIGNLFETGGAGGLPNPEVNPLPAAAKDPIQLSCQSNYHILFTDGTTNMVAKPSRALDMDDIAKGFNTANVAPDHIADELRYLTNNNKPWPVNATAGPYDINHDYPTPFREDPANKQADSLSDIAMYYWIRDLRPAMKNDVPAPAAKGSTPVYAPDLDPKFDIAWWQHVNFNAISFGAEGVLDAGNQATTLKSISQGAKFWTKMTDSGGALNPFVPVNPAGSGGASAVDDLWHATVNARGKFVSAKSPLEVSYGLASILAGIQNQRKARSAAAFSGQVLDAANNTIYETTLEPGWAGDLLRVTIDPKDGTETGTVWQALQIMNATVKPAFAGDEPWFAKRKIVTRNDSTFVGVPFIDTKISAAQLNSLSPDPTQQKKIIAYLRGGTTYGPGPSPTVIEGTSVGQFRDRSTFGYLGDFTNAQAVVVLPPDRPYSDLNDPGYSGFLTAKAARPTRVYAAANDGMVHSFDASNGQEVFAYIPGALFRGVAGTVAGTDVTGIQALTYQDGGVPIYHHHFYVDSSPRVADVDFGNGSGNWHTIMVGGLGKGGNVYYALDITDATAVDENAAAAKVLWEWRNPDNDDDLAHNHKIQSTPGYTFGRPVIVKTRAYGWTVIVTSGYNNKTGVGQLYFLDAATGALKKTMSTGVGTPANPSGFAQIHAFVKDESNQIAEQVYGGDLFGNLWRFDVSSANPAAWTVVQFAKLTDSGGTGQPITTAPQIEVDLNNGINRFVMIGTGRLLDIDDFTNPSSPQQQTAYAIRDGTVTAILTAGLPITRGNLAVQSAASVLSVAGGAPNGWYMDLPTSPSERIVSDVSADVNIFAFIGTQPPIDPCTIALPATLYARDYTSAKSLLADSSGMAIASGTITDSSGNNVGGVGGMLVGMKDPVTGVQTLGWLVSKETGGSAPVPVINPVTGPGNRLSWRLLTGQ